MGKLTDLLSEVVTKTETKKKQREEPYDPMTLKYNIATLMGVIGRRDHMEMMLRDMFFHGPNRASWKHGFLLLVMRGLLRNAKSYLTESLTHFISSKP